MWVGTESSVEYSGKQLSLRTHRSQDRILTLSLESIVVVN